MVGTLASIVIGVLAYLALSFAVAVVMGSVLRGADGSLDGPRDAAATRPLGRRERERPVAAGVRGPLAVPGGAGHRVDHAVSLLPGTVRARCRCSTPAGNGREAPLFRRLRWPTSALESTTALS